MFRTFWLGSIGGNTPPKCISFKWLFNEPADLCGSCSQRRLMLLRRLPDSSINRPITARGFLLYGTLEEHHHAGNHSKARQLPSCTANKEQTGNATEGNTSDSWIGIISGWSQLETSRDLSWKKKSLWKCSRVSCIHETLRITALFSFKCFSFLRSLKKGIWRWRNIHLTCTRKTKEGGKKSPQTPKNSPKF